MNEEASLIFDSRPALRNPYVVCGLTGWVNGGNVSLGGINYLIRQFKGAKFAEMPTAHYHIYQIPGVESLRPVFRMQDGLIVESQLPKNQFYYAVNPASDCDLILFMGTEPNLNWEKYADTVVNLACDFGASRLYAFGGVLDRTPYTREPKMSCACTGAKVKDEMKKYNVTFFSREGPATFNQMLLYACEKKSLEGVSLTVRVPYYPEFNVAIDYSPTSIKAVLVRLNHLMHLGVNFDELNNAIRELEGKLDFFRQQNPQFNTYIEELEKDYVEMPYQEPLDISPNEAIRFAEEFLKENKGQPKGQ
jgi:proteasome assembly chaperone (PAC2) family protein